MLSILNAEERLPRASTINPKDVAEEASLKYERIKMAETNCREAIQGLAKILEPSRSKRTWLKFMSRPVP
jgi:hypothetical protein